MHILTLLFISFVIILLQIYFNIIKSKNTQKKKEDSNSKILSPLKKSRNSRISGINKKIKKEKRSSLMNLLDDISLLNWSSQDILPEKNISFLNKEKSFSFFEAEKSLDSSYDSTNIILKKLRK